MNMQIEIATDELDKACGRALGIVASKSTMPILSMFLLEARIEPEGGRLYLSAFDLENAVRTAHPCKVIEAGAVCIDAARLAALTKAAPENVMTLSVGKNNRITIETGRTKATTPGMHKDEYPSCPVAPSDGFFPVSCRVTRP